MNKIIICILLSIALVPSAMAAKGGPKDKSKPKHQPKLTLVAASASVADTTACGNPYDMQPDKDIYTTVCIPCPSLPDGPGGETVWTPTLYAVATDGFDDNIALLGTTYGCKTDSWYYWT